MPRASIFSWRDGHGWLVLGGGGNFHHEDTFDVDTNVLSRTVSQGPLALIWAAGDVEEADRFLDYLGEQGGRTGYLVDIVMEDDDTIHERLKDAGIIILGDGSNPKRLRNALSGAAIEAMAAAYEDGATIYARGNAAPLLAGWIPPTFEAGFGWLENALVVPYYDDTRGEELKAWLHDDWPDSFGVGLGQGAALALSPSGAVEIWGEQAVTILLGQNLAP